MERLGNAKKYVDNITVNIKEFEAESLGFIAIGADKEHSLACRMVGNGLDIGALILALLDHFLKDTCETDRERKEFIATLLHTLNKYI